MWFRSAVMVLALMSFHSIGTEFPYRGDYPEVKTIELDTLQQDKSTINVVDVRSRLEFDILHIDGAIHITLANKGFENRVKKLASDGKLIAFYCNGITCKKSYKAAQRALKAGVTNVVAYDAGIFLWANAYPSESVLLDSVMQSRSQLISKQDFNARLLTHADFEARLKDSNTLIVDVRDPLQRDTLLFEGLPVRNVPVERFKTFLKNQDPSTKLLIFDAVGKQVQWLQYILDEQNFTHYAFLKGGVDGYLNSQ
ncbi:rhodanese-like domain-containing protein [Vibrio ostreicida]|uniref:rhodanese-like domain-containing protein n=1 Tax=Vibrio ostreicida TaxID=526588 RepID=UPI00097046A3|nr:rhodanese-like domain-containing protein [Vibrio ostreicida]